MAEADQFLNSVIGYHDVTDTGGSRLPRRRQIDFPSGRVEDIDAVTLPDDAWLVDRVEAVSATYVGAPILKRVLDACG